MNVQRSIMAFALGFGMCQIGIAQAPASAPSGSTGVCKDGSYTNSANKSGACRGHKGVQSWFAADTSAAKTSAKSTKESKPSAATAPSTPAAASAPISTAAPAPAAAQSAAPKVTKTAAAANVVQAPGGSPGMVWVNTSTKVYHCSGSSYYGKTKEGKYMTEAEAKAAGAHPDRGKACGQ
jgi:hypothetical protein